MCFVCVLFWVLFLFFFALLFARDLCTMSAASPEPSVPIPTSPGRVFFQTAPGVGCVGNGPVTRDDPVQKKQGKVTVKYDRKELRKRLVLEEWIIEQLSELYDCEVSTMCKMQLHAHLHSCIATCTSAQIHICMPLSLSLGASVVRICLFDLHFFFFWSLLRCLYASSHNTILTAELTLTLCISVHLSSKTRDVTV